MTAAAARKKRRPRQPPVPTHDPADTRRPAAVLPAPSFGVDRPSVVIVLAGLVVALTFTGIFVGSPAGLRWSALFWTAALVCAALAAARFFGSIRGKARLWAEVLDGLGLRGDEAALDAGCGRGLVLIALARRLPDGHVTGVDVWRQQDQSGNSRTSVVLNADLAGVRDRVTVRDGDVRRLDLPDRSFDVVTASLVLHLLPTAADRAAAVGELVRVTKPGGRLVVLDGPAADEVAAALRDAGAVDVQRGPRRWLTSPPTRVITATRPAVREESAAPGS